MEEIEGYKNKDTLEKLYLEEEHSLRDIGEKYNRSVSTIYRWMEKHSIDRRTDAEGGSMKRTVNRAAYFVDNEGYPSWCAWCDGENIKVRVHQLLAISCGYDPEDVFDGRGRTVIHHKNGCKIDNRKENIEVMGADDHIKEHAPLR